MRKTRLVILPGARCLHQLGFLLLFLACPTIAFKGQENRDIQPYCRLLTLKQNWLPNDTGETAGYDENKNDEISGLWDFDFGIRNYCSNNNTVKFDVLSNCQNITDISNLYSFGTKLKSVKYITLNDQEKTMTKSDFPVRRTRSLPETPRFSKLYSIRRESRIENGQRDDARKNTVNTYIGESTQYIRFVRDLSPTRRVVRRESTRRRQSSAFLDDAVVLKGNTFRRSSDTRDVTSGRRQFVSDQLIKRTDGEETRRRSAQSNFNTIRRMNQNECNPRSSIQLNVVRSGIAQRRFSNRRSFSPLQGEFREDPKKTGINLDNKRREDSSPQNHKERINHFRENRIVSDMRNLQTQSSYRNTRTLESTDQRQTPNNRIDSKKTVSEAEHRVSLYAWYNNRNEFRHSRTRSFERSDRQRLDTGIDNRRTTLEAESRETLNIKNSRSRSLERSSRQRLDNKVTRRSSLETKPRELLNERNNNRNEFRNSRSSSLTGSQDSLQERRSESRIRQQFRRQEVRDHRRSSSSFDRSNNVSKSRVSAVVTGMERVREKRDTRRNMNSGKRESIIANSHDEKLSNSVDNFINQDSLQQGPRIASRSSVSLVSTRRDSVERNTGKRTDQRTLESTRQYSLHLGANHRHDTSRARSVSLESRQRYSAHERLSERRYVEVKSRLHKRSDIRIDTRRIRSVSLSQASVNERVHERQSTGIPLLLPVRQHADPNVYARRISLEFVGLEPFNERRIVGDVSVLQRSDRRVDDSRRIRSVSVEFSRRLTEITPRLSSDHQSVSRTIDAKRRITVSHVRRDSMEKRISERSNRRSVALDSRRRDSLSLGFDNYRVKNLPLSSERRDSDKRRINTRVDHENVRLNYVALDLTDTISSRRMLNVLSRDGKKILISTQNSFSFLPTMYNSLSTSINRDRRSNRLEETISRTKRSSVRNYRTNYVEEMNKPLYQGSERRFEKKTIEENKILKELSRQRTLRVSESRLFSTLQQREKRIENIRGVTPRFGLASRIFSLKPQHLVALHQISTLRNNESRAFRNQAAERSRRINVKMDKIRSFEKMDTRSRAEKYKHSRSFENNRIERQLVRIVTEPEQNRFSFISLSKNNFVSDDLSFRKRLSRDYPVTFNRLFNIENMSPARVLRVYNVMTELDNRNVRLAQKLRLGRRSLVHSARQDIRKEDLIDLTNFRESRRNHNVEINRIPKFYENENIRLNREGKQDRIQIRAKDTYSQRTMNTRRMTCAMFQTEQTRRFNSIRDNRLKSSLTFEIRTGEKCQVNKERVRSRFERHNSIIRPSTKETYRQLPTFERTIERYSRSIHQRSLKNSPFFSSFVSPVEESLLGKMNNRETRNYRTVRDQVRFDKFENLNTLTDLSMLNEKFDEPIGTDILTFTASVITDHFAGNQNELTKRLWYDNKRNNEGYTLQALITGGALCAALFLNVNKKKEI